MASVSKVKIVLLMEITEQYDTVGLKIVSCTYKMASIGRIERRNVLQIRSEKIITSIVYSKYDTIRY